MGADGGVCGLLYDVQQTLSLGPCAATVQRAPSHNRWGVSETTLPAKTQGRTLDGPFNFPPPRVAGWFLMCRCQVCNWAVVASVATGLHHVVLQHRVESRLSVVVEWRHHSNQAGTPCRATNPQSGGHRPKKRLRRHGTMADGPRRHWCAYQRRCGNAGSLVSTHRRAPPAGDRPEERRAPTQRLVGTNPRTGRSYLLTLSATTSSSRTSAIACSSSRAAVVRLFGFLLIVRLLFFRHSSCLCPVLKYSAYYLPGLCKFKLRGILTVYQSRFCFRQFLFVTD